MYARIPVKVGEELDVTIEAVGAKGDGIAKEKGFVLFVPGVQKGENVKIRVTKVLRNVGFAEVIGKGTPSAQPAEAPQEPQAEEQEAPPEDSDNFGEEQQEQQE